MREPLAIQPVPQPVDAALEPILDFYAGLGDSDGVFPRILAHSAGYAEALSGAMMVALNEGGLPHELKELVRIQLARTADDPYFSDLRSREAELSEERIEAAASGGFDSDLFSPAERWALRYAWLMYRNPEAVDAAFYDQGKQHFTEAQIMELGGLIAIHYGMQVFMRTLQPPP